MKYLIKSIESYDDEFYLEFYNKLNKYQKRKINKLQDINSKKMSLLGMILVSLELNIPIKDIHYYKKRPYVNSNNIYFSITHKYPYVGIIIADYPVGIDLEILKDVDNNTLNYLKANNNIEALIEWTRKECMYKLNKNICKIKTYIIDRNIILSICYER